MQIDTDEYTAIKKGNKKAGLLEEYEKSLILNVVIGCADVGGKEA